MNWINNVVRPKIQGIWRKREVPENLWIKCPDSGQLVFQKDLESNFFVVPSSNYHMRQPAKQRLDMMFDNGEYELFDIPTMPIDPLKFKDEKRYQDRLKDARSKTGMQDAVLSAKGRIHNFEAVISVQDFSFMGGSLGMVAGESVVTSMLKAVEDKLPYILFAASGGARMQEGILSLMQMPRATVALRALRENGLPYIVVLTNPTTGGVTASYAMLGDIHIAEPGALIGFAGPRVIEQTIRQQLPDGFQRAEYLQEHGMVDMVVHRHDLKDKISTLIRTLMKAEPHESQKVENALLTGPMQDENDAEFIEAEVVNPPIDLNDVEDPDDSIVTVEVENKS